MPGGHLFSAAVADGLVTTYEKTNMLVAFLFKILGFSSQWSALTGGFAQPVVVVGQTHSAPDQFARYCLNRACLANA